MGTSKILIDGVGIDLTQDTVAANKMLSGTKAHDSNGDAITGTIPSKDAATYTPTTTDQTIAAGQYLAGAQTIKGDANLIAGNIKQGVSIFGVSGSLTPGITPTGTKNITENGTYDVTQFASAVVNVPTGTGKAGTITVPTGTHTITIDTGKIDADHIVVYSDVVPTSSSLWLFFASPYHSLLARYSGSTHADELVSDKSVASVATTATINNGVFVLTTPNYLFDAKTYKWVAW